MSMRIIQRGVSGGIPDKVTRIITFQNIQSNKDEEWLSLPSLPRSTFYPVVAVVNRKLYLIGGEPYNRPNEVISYCYDFETFTWSEISEPPSQSKPYKISNCATDGEYIFVLTHNTMLRYDTNTDKWDRMSARPSYSNGVTLSKIGRKIYVFGGNGNVESTATSYDIDTDTWQYIQSMTRYPRIYATSVSLNNSIQIYGGYGASSSDLVPDVGYDPEEDNYNAKFPGSSGFDKSSFPVSVVLNGNIYVMGGYTAGADKRSSNRCYNSITKTWSDKENVLTPRFGMAAVVYEGAIYTMSGSITTLYTNTSALFEKYTPGIAPKYFYISGPAKMMFDKEIRINDIPYPANQEIVTSGSVNIFFYENETSGYIEEEISLNVIINNL